jgi:hypothetical protein
MQSINTLLAGFQQSLLPEVEAYWLKNPFTPVLPEPNRREQQPQETKPAPQKPTSKRRHRSKGKASGWIETREGNTKRRVANTSFYYCYYQWEGENDASERSTSPIVGSPTYTV